MSRAPPLRRARTRAQAHAHDPRCRSSALLLTSADSCKISNIIFMSPEKFGIENVNCRDLVLEGCVFLNVRHMVSDGAHLASESAKDLNYELDVSMVDRYRGMRTGRGTGRGSGTGVGMGTGMVCMSWAGVRAQMWWQVTSGGKEGKPL